MCRIVVCGEKDAVMLAKTICEKTLIVSITNDKNYKVKFPKNKNIHVYRMYFADVIAGPSALKEKDARKLWKHISKNIYKYEMVIIHCHKGESRSAALAGVIGGYYGIDVQYTRTPHPNKWVQDCMIKTKTK